MGPLAKLHFISASVDIKTAAHIVSAVEMTTVFWSIVSPDGLFGARDGRRVDEKKSVVVVVLGQSRVTIIDLLSGR